MNSFSEQEMLFFSLMIKAYSVTMSVCCCMIRTSLKFWICDTTWIQHLTAVNNNNKQKKNCEKARNTPQKRSFTLYRIWRALPHFFFFSFSLPAAAVDVTVAILPTSTLLIIRVIMTVFLLSHELSKRQSLWTTLLFNLNIKFHLLMPDVVNR